MKTFLFALPICLALLLAGVDSHQTLPGVRHVAGVYEDIAACANQRMMDAAAIADGYTGPYPVPASELQGDAWELPLGGRTIESVSHERIRYCGQHVDGTVVTLSDGWTARFPGRGVLARVGDGVAELRLGS